MSSLYNIVTDCLDKHIKQFPHDTALIVANELRDGVSIQKYSYLALYEKTLKIAESLHQMGGRPGHRVLVRVPNGLFFCALFLGIMRAGLIPVPVSTMLSKDEIMFMLKDSEARFIFIDASSPLDLKDYQGFPVFVDVSEERESEVESPTQEPMGLSTDAQSPAYWLYTSGTEGLPKAVIHAHRSIPAHDVRIKNWQGAKSGDVVLNTSALNWSYALTAGFLDCLRHKITVATYRGSLKPESLLRAIELGQVTHLLSVPGIYRRLLREESLQDKTKNVRVFLSAGEKLPEELRSEFKIKTGHTIREGLGMTEHSVFLFQAQTASVLSGSCGVPAHDGDALILRDDLSRAAPGEVGILASHKDSTGLMLGYHNRPDQMRQVFQGDYFLSGDLAKVDEQNNFYYVARRDDVITAGGYRISPLEVESVINLYPGVVESLVTGKEIEPGKVIIKAYLVTHDLDSVENIKSFVAEKLASYKRPRDYELVANLPKTVTGKLKRNFI